MPKPLSGNPAQPLDSFGATVTVLLCLTWGLNQVAVKLAMAGVPPLMQATIRSAGALAIVAAWARLRGVKLTARDGTLAAGLLAGLLFAGEFLLIYRGLMWTTASRAVVFIYTAPFFVALGARWLGERLSLQQWCGLALSFLGVAVAIGVPQAAVDASVLVGDLMMVGAGAAWGATTLVIKGSALARAPAEKTLAWQLLVSVPVLAAGAAAFGERMAAMPDAVPLAWLAYQTIWVVGVTYAVWFALIKRYSASRLSAFTFLTPLFGVVAGAVVLDEPIAPAFGIAVALVIAGLVLVNRLR
ncbi:MAG TPA: DMT family transporter [Xanthobacteraceae bacterium]